MLPDSKNEPLKGAQECERLTVGTGGGGVLFSCSRFLNFADLLSLSLEQTMYFLSSGTPSRKSVLDTTREQRFLSCMAFSVYKVVRVACLSRSWFVYAS